MLKWMNKDKVKSKNWYSWGGLKVLMLSRHAFKREFHLWLNQDYLMMARQTLDSSTPSILLTAVLDLVISKASAINLSDGTLILATFRSSAEDLFRDQ